MSQAVPGLAALLPLKLSGRHYADNLGRMDILLSSLLHFGGPGLLDAFLVVTPADEVPVVRRYLDGWPEFEVSVIVEEDHFPAFRRYRRPWQVRPWQRQQIIKLAAPDLTTAPFVLTLDPDVVAVQGSLATSCCPEGARSLNRSPALRTLVVAGVGRCSPRRGGADRSWDRRHPCAAVPRRPPEPPSTDRSGLRPPLDGHPPDDLRRLDRVHPLPPGGPAGRDAGRPPRVGRSHGSPAHLQVRPERSVWSRHEASADAVARLFEKGDPGLFAVIQSNAGMPAADVAAVVATAIPLRRSRTEDHPAGDRHTRTRRPAGAFGRPDPVRRADPDSEPASGEPALRHPSWGAPPGQPAAHPLRTVS